MLRRHHHPLELQLRLHHKTVLTLLSAVLFAGLLAGHHLLGWRGVTAVRLTVAAFALLLLGFFGSQLVLEIIPNARRIGVVYNSGELNSVIQVEEARQWAAEYGLTLVERTAGSTTDVPDRGVRRHVRAPARGRGRLRDPRGSAVRARGPAPVAH